MTERVYQHATVETTLDSHPAAERVVVGPKGIYVTHDGSTHTYPPSAVVRIEMTMDEASLPLSRARRASIAWGSGTHAPFRQTLDDVLLLRGGWLRVLSAPDDGGERTLTDYPPHSYNRITWKPE